MPKLTPAEFRERHARRTKAAIQDMADGINRVTTSPTAQAAAKIDKMAAGFNAKVQDGTIKARLQAVTLEDWRSAALNKGIGRVSAGVDGAAAKTEAFASQFLPFLDTVKATVDKLPDLTLEDSINRMTTQVRLVAKFRKK